MNTMTVHLTTIPHTVRSIAPVTDTSVTRPRSLTMYSMHEALARDRMRETEQRSRDARLASRLASERRYHRAELRRQRRTAHR